MGLTAWATLDGAPVGDGGPILSVLGGEIVLTEVGQFGKSSIVCAASDARAILAMRPRTLIEVVQDGVGTLAYGYVLNPRQQIQASEEDPSVITLTLEPLTSDAARYRLHRGWQLEAKLSVVAYRLGTFAPGWSGGFSGQGTADDLTVLATQNDGTPVEAFLAVAKQFGQYARLGVDENNVPTRVLEMGQFGAAPTLTLVDGAGGNADEIAASGLNRLVATVDRQPNDITSLTTVCTPFGGGSSTDTVVTLERLWRILNDPSYINYGRYGTDAESIARWGGNSTKTSVFPEYDPNYPISDPQNPPTGNWTYLMPDYTIVSPSPSRTLAQILAAGGQLMQGWQGTRYPCADGNWDYMVHDRASYAANGHYDKAFGDPGLNYTDSSVANQELTARALYISAVANFKRFGHPHDLITCTADGIGRPTRGGDFIALDYGRVSAGEGGAVVEMSAIETLRVMRVVRSFQGEETPTDTYTLSSLGRFDETDATGEADTARALVALTRQQGTGLAKDSVVIRDNIDAANPITHWYYISAEHFRFRKVRVRCDWYPFRGTATTAVNSAATITLSVPHGTHDLSGTFDSSLTDLRHAHATDLSVGGSDAPLGTTVHFIRQGGRTSFLQVGWKGPPSENSPGGQLWTNDWVPGGLANNADPNHKHATTFSNAPIALEHPDTLTGPLPQHTHDVEKRIPTGQPLPASITMEINGQPLSSGARATGTRDGSGAFTSPFIVDSIGPQLDLIAPDTDVALTFRAGTSAANPFGVGYVVITITEIEELGGLTSTVRLTA